MHIQDVFEFIKDDLEGVETFLQKLGTGSRVDLLSEVGSHILAGGGKRFRAALSLLCGRISGTPPDHRIPLAASIELIHNATLLHDDIVDRATLRRGQPAAYLVWGDPAGVLAANFQFSSAFLTVLKYGGISALRIVNASLKALTEGELSQFLRIGAVEINEAEYREIILRKTACLISTACHIGAIVGTCKEKGPLLARFGLEVGMGFQMIDDVLDYTSTSETLGKRVGTDFREGKFTLPLITALSRVSREDREQLLSLLQAPPEIREAHFLWAKELIEKQNGFDYTRNSARAHIQGAIQQLSDFPYSTERDALETMALYVVERSY